MDLSKIEFFTNIIDKTLLVILSLFILAYSLFTSTFAELALHLSFLSFPVFVGEILLIFCSVLMLIKFSVIYKHKRPQFNKWHGVIGLFLIWILAKAFWGYYQYGPLAFRNSALFYYSWFGVIGYFVFLRQKMNEYSKILVMLIITFFTIVKMIGSYNLWFYLALLLILALSFKKRMWQYAGIALFTGLFIMKFSQFFEGSRSHLVSSLSVFLFLSSTSLILIALKTKTWQRLLIGFSFMIILAFGLFKFADYNEIKSMTTPKEVLRLYKERVVYIKEREKDFQFRQLDVNLYNPNVSKEESYIETIGNKVDQKIKWKKNNIDAAVTGSDASGVLPSETLGVAGVDISAVSSDVTDVLSSAKVTQKTLRPLSHAYGNIVFRLLLWRDMIIEMIEEKAWLGINFGKPQRSKSLEITRWALTEWTRDGWITPHNSFLHMIYRGGVMGAAFVGFIFYLLIVLVRSFMKNRSFRGIILISVLVYWIMLSQFLVILEFPYFAISFWVVFGATLAYAHQIEKSCENTSYS